MKAVRGPHRGVKRTGNCSLMIPSVGCIVVDVGALGEMLCGSAVRGVPDEVARDTGVPLVEIRTSNENSPCYASSSER